MVAAQNGYNFTLEDVNGTRKEPTPTDSNVILMGGGQVTVSFGNEVIGKRADGTLNDGPVGGGQQTVSVPEFMMNLIGTDEALEPKSWKFAKMCGAKVEDLGVDPDVENALVWDGVPTCFTGSGDFLSLGCGGKGELIKARGMKGNMTIGWEGANAPILMKVNNLMGAYVSTTAVTDQDHYTVVGDDTGKHQTAGMYTTTFAGAVYQVTTLTFDPAYGVTSKPANNISGIDHTQVTSGEMRVNMTLIKLDTGDTVIDSAKNNTTETITIAGDESIGASYDITFSGCQVLEPSAGEVDGYTAFELSTTVQRAEFKLKVVA